MHIADITMFWTPSSGGVRTFQEGANQNGRVATGVYQVFKRYGSCKLFDALSPSSGRRVRATSISIAMPRRVTT